MSESDSKIEQLNSLIGESNNIATIAQEKLDHLEEKGVPPHHHQAKKYKYHKTKKMSFFVTS